MMSKPENISAIIMAGGNSSRMKFPKPWLNYSKNQSFLQRIIEQYQKAEVSHIIVILNRRYMSPDWKGKLESVKTQATLVPNAEVHRGRLFSLQLGLNKTLQSEYVFIHNVDNPYVQLDTLIDLKNKKVKKGVTLPEFNKKNGHPIIISRDVQDDLIAEKGQDVILRELLKKYNRKQVKTKDQHVLTNLNTPEDYWRARREFA